MTKAISPKAAFVPALAASLAVLFAAGCGNFWENPSGTSTGTTATTTTLTTSNSSVSAGGTDTLTADVSPTAATGTVIFYSNNSSIGSGTLTSAAASYTATFTTAGTYSLTATYQGNSTYASSSSSAVSVTVTAAAADASRPGMFNPATASRATNLVLDPAGTFTLTASSHLHNIAGVELTDGTVQNIDSGGHCVFYSGSVYLASDSEKARGDSDSSGVYEISGGGYLAPEGTKDLDCE
jgi:hypothetical protein